MSDSGEKKSEKGEKAEPKYSLAQLVAESRPLLGVASHVAAGALHFENSDELTVAEAKKAVEDFQSKKVAK